MKKIREIVAFLLLINEEKNIKGTATKKVLAVILNETRLFKTKFFFPNVENILKTNKYVKKSIESY